MEASVSTILRRANNIKLFAATICLLMGYGVYATALIWFVRYQSGSESSVGILLAIAPFTGLFFLPISGPLIDRSRRHVLWARLQLMLVFVLTCMMILYFTHRLQIWHIYIAALFEGFFFAVTLPNMGSLIKDLAQDEKELRVINSARETSYQIGLVTAGLSGGFLIQYTNFGVVLLLSIGLYILAALALSSMHYTVKERNIQVQRISDFSTNFVEGLGYLRAQPWLIFFGLLCSMSAVTTSISNVVNVSYVIAFWKGDALSFGLVSTCFGLGAVVAGYLVIALQTRVGEIASFISVQLVSTVLMIVLVVNRSIPIAILCFISLGIFNTAGKIMYTNILLKRIDNNFIGRVMAIFAAINDLLISLLSLGVGVLIERIPVQNGYLVLAGLLFASVTSATILQRRRLFELIPDQAKVKPAL